MAYNENNKKYKSIHISRENYDAMLGMGNMKTSMNDVLNIIMKKANVKSSAAAKEDKM